MQDLLSDGGGEYKAGCYVHVLYISKTGIRQYSTANTLQQNYTAEQYFIHVYGRYSTGSLFFFFPASITDVFGLYAGVRVGLIILLACFSAHCITRMPKQSEKLV